MTFDTLGTTKTFSSEALEKGRILAKSLENFKSRAEFDLVSTQTGREGDQEKKDQLKEEIDGYTASIESDEAFSLEAKIQAYVDANDGQALSEDKKSVIADDLAVAKTLEVIAKIADHIKQDVAETALLPEPNLKILAAASFFVGFRHLCVIDKKDQIDGEKIKKLVAPGDLIGKINEKGVGPNLRGPRLGLEKVQKLEYVKNLLPENFGEGSEEGPGGYDFLYKPLLKWLQVAIDVRERDVAARKAQAEAEAAAAAAPAEGEEVTEGEAPAPEVDYAAIDDDFVPLE
jgi:hypothetical protein